MLPGVNEIVVCVIAFQCELSLVSSTIAFSLLIVLSTIFYLALILFMYHTLSLL